MTSSQLMAEGLGRRCDQSHKHQHLVGGRAADAALYPIPLIRSILKGVRATTDWEVRHKSARDAQTELIHGFSFNQGTIPFCSSPSEPVKTSQITRTNGGKVEIEFQDRSFKPRYLDEYTGEVLDPKLIRCQGYCRHGSRAHQMGCLQQGRSQHTRHAGSSNCVRGQQDWQRRYLLRFYSAREEQTYFVLITRQSASRCCQEQASTTSS